MRKNEKGGAAAVAIMVIIMIVAIICTVLVVTGRFAIKKSEVENDVKASSSEAESSSEEISETDLSSVAPEPEPVNLYPTKSADYHEIDLDDITCSEAILINADTNEIIAGLNYEKQIYPASLTKILTLMVAVENIDDLKATYKFTEDDIAPLVEDNASMVGFEPGEEVTL
ncbi:MAG: D-alanyl-D-alanine carboxypeptidase, partial [Ruminococcus sp.]|nr:D-alanyl-D-alanine carboxypeptidase [Ruminococcus sp.]